MLDFAVFSVVPVLIWAYYRLTTPSQPVEFDFDVQHSTFTLLLAHYQVIARWMASADILLALVGVFSKGDVRPIRCAVAGAVFSLVFSVYLLAKYETYVHHRYPRAGGPGVSNYSVSAYALTRALGLSAVVFTVMAVVGVCL
jgi:hypothetical protein